MPEPFSIVKKGYDMKEVDDRISQLTSEIDAYKAKEAAISRAILRAEMSAKQIIVEADKEADAKRAQVNEEITSTMGVIKKMIQSEKMALEDFCVEYDNTVRKYFTGKAADITAPLKEKIALLESIADEAEEECRPKEGKNEPKPEHTPVQSSIINALDSVDKPVEISENINPVVYGEEKKGEDDPLEEIKNYF